MHEFTFGEAVAVAASAAKTQPPFPQSQSHRLSWPLSNLFWRKNLGILTALTNVHITCMIFEIYSLKACLQVKLIDIDWTRLLFWYKCPWSQQHLSQSTIFFSQIRKPFYLIDTKKYLHVWPVATRQYEKDVFARKVGAAAVQNTHMQVYVVCQF